jgi:allophanate hydrolase subunit 1
VGIADNQTAVYPINSAGGWNIVGRTPLDLSVHNPTAVNLFSVGQRIKFEPIDRQQFIELGGVL